MEKIEFGQIVGGWTSTSSKVYCLPQNRLFKDTWHFLIFHKEDDAIAIYLHFLNVAKMGGQLRNCIIDQSATENKVIHTWIIDFFSRGLRSVKIEQELENMSSSTRLWYITKKLLSSGNCRKFFKWKNQGQCFLKRCTLSIKVVNTLVIYMNIKLFLLATSTFCIPLYTIVSNFYPRSHFWSLGSWYSWENCYTM